VRILHDAGEPTIMKKGGSVIVNDTEYRGEVDVVERESGFDVVNRVELEDYLKGVLPREMHHMWPSSSLKAQAVASRSFAVYEAIRRKDKEYDLTADTFSQVYGGKGSEKWRATRAVEATKGEVLEYDGKIFPAYFHSSCGGHTADASQIWGEGLPPLKGVKCSWCRWSPHFRWMARIPTKTIAEKLKSKGYAVKHIDNIKAGKRDSSGRLKYVSVKSGNKWLEIKTGEFRSAVGKKSLRSAKFRIKKYPFFYLFSGHGWGHGVGMCQWGAFGLAMRWWNYKKIVAYYYPGTKIVSLGEILKQ
jgi:stage II sporulation protein D